jgi:hypothetical protein
MSKNYSLLIICLLVSVGLYAAERVSGQIVYADKTVDVTMLIPVGLFGGGPNTEALQKRVRYLDAKGKKRWLKPDQAKEFRFSLNGQGFRMVSRPYVGSLFAASPNVFLLQVIDGPVKMFEYRMTTRSAGGPNMPSTSNQTISYLLQRGEEKLNEPNVFGFKKEMAEYFADCPKLVALIEEKEFKRRDIGEIVIFYNTQCNKSR